MPVKRPSCGAVQEMCGGEMQKKRVILASASPRRKELLEQMGLVFEIVPSKKEEVFQDCAPGTLVEHLACQKAADVAEKILFGRLGQGAAGEEDTLVIGSDTIVVCGGKVMGKPKTPQDAFDMLCSLQGRTHEVYTGVALACVEGNKIAYDIFHEKTSVTVHAMTDQEIWGYIAKQESMDKAGAYGIQGAFSVFVDRIEGEYGTVLGLPVAGLYQALKKYL